MTIKNRININSIRGILFPDKIKPVKIMTSKIGIKKKENLFKLFLKVKYIV